MAIEINGAPSSLIHTAGGDVGQISPNSSNAPTSGSTEQSARPDQFSLTDSATRLQKLENDVSNQSVVDNQKVADLQRSLATGSFQIDPARVAEKMLKMEHGLP